jgi:hypothetical protein
VLVIWGLGLRVEGSGLSACHLGFRVYESQVGFRELSLQLRDWG